MTPDPRRLIVSTAGSANAFGTIRSVRAHYGDAVFVIATDTNRREMVAASVLADAFVQVPLAHSPEFPEGNLPPGLELIAPPYNVIRLCSDKWAMHQWLRANGLPSPETALATPAALERMGGPVALKPREGYASKLVRLVGETAELADIDPNCWLLQEQLRENEVALDVFLSRSAGRFSCVCREYLELRAGVVTNARVFSDPVLVDIAERLARSLPFSAYSCFRLCAMRRDGGRSSMSIQEWAGGQG